jgi:hypothetical protein
MAIILVWRYPHHLFAKINSSCVARVLPFYGATPVRVFIGPYSQVQMVGHQTPKEPLNKSG